jgi:hypothetical protein
MSIVLPDITGMGCASASSRTTVDRAPPSLPGHTTAVPPGAWTVSSCERFSLSQREHYVQLPVRVQQIGGAFLRHISTYAYDWGHVADYQKVVISTVCGAG